VQLTLFECSQIYSDNITIGYAWFLSPVAEMTRLRLLTMMLKNEVRVTDYIAGILSAIVCADEQRWFVSAVEIV